MRLATIKTGGAEIAGIVMEKGILPIKALNEARATVFSNGSEETGFAAFGGDMPLFWEETMLPLIETGQIRQLTRWYNEGGREKIEELPGFVPLDEVVYAPLYRDPKRYSASA